MIIGQFNDAYPPIMDGVANVVKNYAYWINKKYTKCYVVAPAVPNYKEPDDYVIRFKSWAVPGREPYRYGTPQWDGRFKKRLKTIKFDLIHAHCPLVAGKWAVRIARQQGIPSIISFHSKFYDDFLTAVKFKFIAKIMLADVIKTFNQFDYVWTVNKSTAATLREYGYEKEIDIVRNGADFESLPDIPGALREINEMYKLDPEIPLLLFVGQHIWQKNVETIIRSCAIMKQKQVPFKMFFVGRGPHSSGMMKLAQDLKLENDISFLGPIYDRHLLRKIYQRATLFMFPSLYDNAPIVVQEAAASDCPSVLVENSNAAEGVTHKVNGYISKNTPEDFAETAIQALANPKEYQAVVKQAKSTVYKSWESVMDEVYPKYMEIIEEFKRKKNLASK